jgi:hypothetical protein
MFLQWLYVFSFPFVRVFGISALFPVYLPSKAVIYTPPRPFLQLFTTCKYMFVNTFSAFCFSYFNSFTFTPLFYNVYIVNCKRIVSGLFGSISRHYWYFISIIQEIYFRSGLCWHDGGVARLPGWFWCLYLMFLICTYTDLVSGLLCFFALLFSYWEQAALVSGRLCFFTL